MEIDLSSPALALVATQDTTGTLRRTFGTLVFLTVVTDISLRWTQYRVLYTLGRLFLSSPVLVRRERRFLIFWGAFSGRYFVLSMFECHVRFERIFDKISEYVG